MDFAWLNDIIQAFLKVFPRPVIVRATHGGVKWRFGKYVREMKPGWHIIWPLTTEYEVIVTARQTNNLPAQSVMTADNKAVVVSVLIVFSVKDVVQAIGERNWDADTTVNDITQASVVAVVSKYNLSDLLRDLTGKVAEELTDHCRKQLRQFGVYIHRVAFTDFCPSKVLRLHGIEKFPGGHSM
ncbi:MAG: hypothetical protein AMXMBFR16_10430 [Candidatus Uhrbacteria bacterium]